MIGGTLRLVLVGTTLGTLGAIAFAVLCCVISWAIVSAISWMNPGNIDKALTLGIRFATAGAIAGGIVGALIAIDRFVDRKAPPSLAVEKHRAARLPARSALRNGTPLPN
jgi:hypothetical protein